MRTKFLRNEWRWSPDKDFPIYCDTITHDDDTNMFMCKHILPNGKICERAFKTMAGLKNHKSVAFVVAPQCPWCKSRFADKQSATNHVKNSFLKDVCHTDRATLPVSSEIIEYYTEVYCLHENCLSLPPFPSLSRI